MTGRRGVCAAGEHCHVSGATAGRREGGGDSKRGGVRSENVPAALSHRGAPKGVGGADGRLGQYSGLCNLHHGTYPNITPSSRSSMSGISSIMLVHFHYFFSLGCAFMSHHCRHCFLSAETSVPPILCLPRPLMPSSPPLILSVAASIPGSPSPPAHFPAS